MTGPAPTNGNGNGGLKWQTWGGILVAAVAVIGSIVSFASSLSDARNQITTALTHLENVDRRLDGLSQRQGLDAAGISSLNKSLDEVETQFCADEDVRNLIHAADLRTVALLWKKSFGDEYPTTDVYFAKICKR